MLRHVASRERPAALVVDVGFVNGLAAVRTLGRAGVPVLALDHRPSALGLRSRLGLPVLCPNPTVDEDGFVDFLDELGSELPAPAPVFATHDEALNALAAARDRLEGRFRFPFPRSGIVAEIQSKRTQLERATLAGIDTPATAHPSSAEEARSAAERIGYPVLVKPSDPVGFKHRYRRQAFRCNSPPELADAYAKAEPFSPMVQELIPGGDDALYTVGSYLDLRGEALGVFCGRKLRQTPPGIGTCRVGEAVWVDEAVDATASLLRAFSYTGVSQVELKRDERDGRFKLMEINPRLWQWHGLAAACGVDVVRMAYDDLLGEPVATASSRGHSRRWAIALVPGERPILVRPPDVEAVVALDDPRPALVHVARYLRNTLR